MKMIPKNHQRIRTGTTIEKGDKYWDSIQQLWMPADNLGQPVKKTDIYVRMLSRVTRQAKRSRATVSLQRRVRLGARASSHPELSPRSLGSALSGLSALVRDWKDERISLLLNALELAQKMKFEESKILEAEARNLESCTRQIEIWIADSAPSRRRERASRA